MKRKSLIFAASIMFAAIALPVAAWADTTPTKNGDQDKQVAKLQVDGGVIMLSRDQAPFASGATDDPLFHKERLMVSEQSVATVIYNDGCRQKYDKPGIYVIGDNCVPPVAWFSGDSAIPTTGLVIAGAVAGGVIGYNLHHCPPVSR